MQPQQPVSMATVTFNSEDPKYKCCCQSCHVKQGTMIIAIIEGVALAINAVGALFTLNILGIIPLAISGLIVGCLFYALNKERSGYLIPHLIWQVVSIVGLIVIGVIIVVGLAITGGAFITHLVNSAEQEGHKVDPEASKALAAGLVVLGGVIVLSLLVGAALEIWFFTIILGCYRYFQDKERLGITDVGMGQPGYVIAPPPQQPIGYAQQQPAPYGYGHPPSGPDAPPAYKQ